MIAFEDNNQVVKLQDGAGIPIVFIHPIGGTIFVYKKLLSYLNTDSPVYGIQDNFNKRYESINEQAKFYLEQFFDEIDANEIMLAGQSSGGTLAHEMSYHCLANGLKVSKLIMFDTWVKAPYDKDFKEYFEKIIIRQAAKIINKDAEIKKIFLNKMWERMNVIFNHLPKKSDVDMILFTASECVEEYNVDQNIQYAWEPYVKSILKISTPGNHETMLEEPSIESLASKLDEYVS